MRVPAEIMLDLPAPMSVNRTRKIDWHAKARMDSWARVADAIVMSQGKLIGIKGPFELHITMSGSISKLDLDNGLKQTIDYLRRIEVIENDDPKFMRRLVVDWGTAPEGCRVIVREFA
jgi:Holliday junction resolvase RusA-like endonuclease